MNRRKFLLNCGCSIVPLTSSIPAFAQQRPRPAAPPNASAPPATRAASAVSICGTRDPEMAMLRRSIELSTRTKESMSTPREIVIPVNFHIVHAGTHGKIEEARLDRQIALLNEDFRSAGVSFFKNQVGHYDNPAWFTLMPVGFDGNNLAELQMKRALARDSDRSLNFYTLEPVVADLLGWATFPWDRETSPVTDGIVVRHSSIPSGTNDASDLGRTATHEVGHWLGLLHTFQNGCADPGDGVDDTPFQARPTAGCPVPVPSCGADRGADAIDNHMNYSSESCRKQFSAGQITRMHTMTAVFRPRLIKGAPTETPAASVPAGTQAPNPASTPASAAASKATPAAAGARAAPAPASAPAQATGSGASGTTDAINQLLK